MHARASVLAVDTRAVGDRLERLPAVAEAVVSASLAALSEKCPVIAGKFPCDISSLPQLRKLRRI